MNISPENGKKLEEIFDILEFSKVQRVDELERLGEALLMEVAAEAFIEKSEESAKKLSTKDDLARFLLENCSENEIKEIMQRVFRDTAAEYFYKIVRDLENEEQKEKIELLLNSLE